MTQTLSQNYSRQDLIQDFRALKVLVFRTVCVEYPSSMLARFRVRERIYLSDRFIFKISEVKGQPDGFSWLVKDRITSAQLKTLNSLLCFLQVQNCWRWPSLILSSSSTKTRDPDKNQVVLCSHAGFVLLSADGAKSNSFLICSLEIGFVWTTLTMMPVFLRAFVNALIIYFPGQRYWKTVCCAAWCEGNVQWRL